ncbi:tRNA (N(6)-L-threonylcarbamoyladenosine(37)-C(2))-methylthiotransferase [Candidatus Bathycorpusculum sp.]|uniref:tRNA (N(6)-L-threonylcarbamoyladenosine(37)-C(2))- methylthiotransferase n=1 Tax=Candidatus Bathycorpusculum sp. TaxID=2994959 RepID=UPI00282C3CB3|nr:tRNA (N(6)-L-threonylcarbamoyladenosine(37)-C(2))-methylthiotransferase [Candidatus Termitimicrobium sp.]MCL2432135.1 tRNA (N(6)-L-threonylcarbamoyladenosine(37)-C(2))-methylthiotransferase [Candidatus Termitimicrobium sp.]
MHTIFIKNYGCSSNTADGETLAGCLKQAGYTLTTNQTQADLIIYNTCAVKGPTENRIINDIKQTPKNKKIIITGCLPKINLERLTRETTFNGATGPAAGEKIINIVKEVIDGQKPIALTPPKENPPLTLPKLQTNPLISIIPINFGCLGSCTYCCVVHARGHLQSYSIPQITQRIQTDYNAGCQEFWLTSQDTASYGQDLKTNLANLLHATTQLTGNFYIRIGMMTPNLITPIQTQLINAFKNPHIFKFLHLPLQSGDNTILTAMNRFYTANDFQTITQTFREQFPNLTLATDIIVGFPGETTQAFNNTLTLLKKTQPDITNISKFFARPKTPAWHIKDGLVDKEEIKHRSTLTSELTKKISTERNKKWLGWSGEVLVDEKGKTTDSWISRNFAYKPIVIKSNTPLIGKTLQVEITETSPTYLSGKILK